ncbi:unnamed protein product, partial [Ranitomeya imitator]
FKAGQQSYCKRARVFRSGIKIALHRRVLRRTENELQSNIAASMQPAGKERSAERRPNQNPRIQLRTPHRIAILGLLLLILNRHTRLRQRRQRRRAQKRMWVHPLVAERTEKGHFYVLYNDLRRYPDKFLSFCRLSILAFDRLLTILAPHLTLQDTVMRKAISAEERLLITLRYVECTFGIMTSQWRIFHTAIQLDTDTVDAEIKACCVLHNYAREYNTDVDVEYQQPVFNPVVNAGLGRPSKSGVRLLRNQMLQQLLKQMWMQQLLKWMWIQQKLWEWMER